MPRATFTGVRLEMVGDTSISIKFPDVTSIETFLKMKAACDAVVQPELVPETQTRSK